MKFNKDTIVDVKVIKSDERLYEIKTMQRLTENERRVTLRCAEHVDLFKRGFTCDLDCHYEISDFNMENEEHRSYLIKDLVLVYINKSYDVNSYPVIDYVFYK